MTGCRPQRQRHVGDRAGGDVGGIEHHQTAQTALTIRDHDQDVAVGAAGIGVCGHKDRLADKHGFVAGGPHGAGAVVVGGGAQVDADDRVEGV